MSHDFDSDISLKDVILKLQDYAKACLKAWLLIGILAIVFAIIFVLLKKNAPKEYNATLTFMLNEDERGGISGLAGMLGSFGLGIGSSESNLDKILELSKSRRITQNAIFTKCIIDNKEDYLGNHFIALLEEHNQWYEGSSLFSSDEDSLSLENFRFSHDSIAAFSTLENKALKKVHAEIAGNDKKEGVLYCYYNELSGIMSLAIDSYDDEIAVSLSKTIFEKLSDYYVDKAVEKQRYDFEIIKEKYDSINNALSSVEYRLAAFEDSNRDLFRKKDILTKSRLSTEKQKLQYMSGKAEEQLQLAQLTLDNKTPYIQVIDYPLLPLKPTNRSIFFYLILGLFLGGFLGVSYVIIKKFYNDTMSSNI